MSAAHISIAFLALAFAGIGEGALDPLTRAVIDPEAVRLIESRVDLPGRALILAEYDRYYVLERVHGADVLQGRYLARSLRIPIPKGAEHVLGVPGAFTVSHGDELPDFFDGGCSVISISVALPAEAHNRIWANCNGSH